MYAFTNVIKQRYYQFAVKAVNDVGDGDMSLLSSQIYTGGISHLWTLLSLFIEFFVVLLKFAKYIKPPPPSLLFQY